MATLQMISWKQGLRTVSLIEAVKKHSTGSLMQAKADVEKLLEGRIVALEFDTDAGKKAFQREAELLGVTCR